jgi:hypothetical protein
LRLPAITDADALCLLYHKTDKGSLKADEQANIPLFTAFQPNFRSPIHISRESGRIMMSAKKMPAKALS